MAFPYIHDNLFEINDNLKVYQKTIGSFQYLYVDDFYKNAEKIHAMFENSWFPNWKISKEGRNFKDYYDCRMRFDINKWGLKNENKTKDFFNTFIDLSNFTCNEIYSNIFTWINTPKKEIQFWPHTDPTFNFLVTLDKINSGGTALYSRKPNNPTPEEIDIQFDTTNYESDICVIPSVFNRLVVFDGSINHGGYIEDHSKYSNGNWRYNTVYFFYPKKLQNRGTND